MNIYNVAEIDEIVEKFLQESKVGISNVYKFHFKNSDSLSLNAFIESLKEELKTGTISFINKNDHLNGIYSYLFYIVNASCKRNAASLKKKSHEYLCPGCSYFKKDTIIDLYKDFSCHECQAALKTETDPKKIVFFKTFAFHSKKGYRCMDCDRFIPHSSIHNGSDISCPYLDCLFAGNVSSLKGMHHPSTTYTAEISTQADTLEKIVGDTETPLQKLEEKQEKQDILNLVSEVIESQKSLVHYSGSVSTSFHKLLIYQAITNLLSSHEEEMIDYLIYNSRSGGFQHKIFQQYVSLLEEKLPISFKKNNKVIRIASLLDENLNLFDGISSFTAMVNENCEIKNNTAEFYIGGRKGYVARPFYIGKLLSLINVDNDLSIMDNVKEYSFNKIKLKGIKPGTNVNVTHLRIIPHYQMGGMTHVNRIRKKIVDKVKASIEKTKEY